MKLLYPANETEPGPGVLGCSDFGCPRECLQNRFVYVVLSPRARGLSVGVNLNPNKRCDFDCVYCEVDRRASVVTRESLDVAMMGRELEETLEFVHAGRIAERPCYCDLPQDLLQLRQVALSGDGEPTQCPNFVEAVETVVHVRARGKFPFFKIVLITNSSGLDRPEVQEGLEYFVAQDEIWAKLDAGSQEYMNRVNRSTVPLERILANILSLARRRPVIIQSLFPLVDGVEPPSEEIESYAQRLKQLKEDGAQLPLVQIYSATRPTPHSECGHLPLKSLSAIARRVRDVTGLHVEVF